ncbi:MAG: DUF21 domain-containing protein [Alphaproteobacteria bacterium]|nr:DUF21 domain-containing protein [Alphaproteobacteria bacterium]
MISYIILVLLLICSFFFSGTETALTAVSAPLLHEQEKQGNKRAALLNRLRAKSDKLLGTLLFGNNIVNIATTAISTGIMIDFFGEHLGVILSTCVVSVVILVFSEILPKTYALSIPYTFSIKVTPVLNVCVHLFYPFVAALNWISKCTLRFLPRSKQTLNAEEKLKAEIRGTLDLDKGTALAQEQSMLKSVLDLDDITVEDVMQHRSHIVSLNIATAPQDIFKFISQTPFSRIPLWRGRRDNIVGILHVKAVLKMMTRSTSDHKKLNVLDYCAKPWFVLNTTNLMDQLHAFKKRREHFALVVNEYGDLQGLVTLEDVLEEIVGDISDENDKPEESLLQPVKTESGAWRVDGSTTIRDLNRHFKWELPDENATTIAGLVLYLAERIPKQGKTFMLDGFTFVVAGREGNRLTHIDILPPAH